MLKIAPQKHNCPIGIAKTSFFWAQFGTKLCSELRHLSRCVDMGGPQADPPQVDALFHDAVFDMALDDGLKTYALNEHIDEPKAASPKAGMVACNACNRKQPLKYVPSMQGNKYQVALAQITTSLGTSDTSMALAKMSTKLMSKGIHQRADIV